MQVGADCSDRTYNCNLQANVVYDQGTQTATQVNMYTRHARHISIVQLESIHHNIPSAPPLPIPEAACACSCEKDNLPLYMQACSLPAPMDSPGQHASNFSQAGPEHLLMCLRGPSYSLTICHGYRF